MSERIIRPLFLQDRSGDDKLPVGKMTLTKFDDRHFTVWVEVMSDLIKDFDMDSFVLEYYPKPAVPAVSANEDHIIRGEN